MRDVSMSISVADLRVDMTAEGVAWSPDVAKDMVNRTVQAFRETWEIAGEYVLMGLDDSDEEPDASDTGSDS